jgi:hypothetical protein
MDRKYLNPLANVSLFVLEIKDCKKTFEGYKIKKYESDPKIIWIGFPYENEESNISKYLKKHDYVHVSDRLSQNPYKFQVGIIAVNVDNTNKLPAISVGIRV